MRHSILHGFYHGEGGVSGVNVDAVVFGLFSRCELCCLTLRVYCTSIDWTYSAPEVLRKLSYGVKADVLSFQHLSV